jgi:chromosome segregation ATPase
VDVAIELNLRQAEVSEFYREYCQVYEEIKGDIHSFVKLYKLAKAVGMNAQHVGKLLVIADNHLPVVEYRYQELKREEASLEAGNRNSARTFQELSDHISATRDTLEQYESDCKKRGLEIKNLNKVYKASQELVDDFQNNNEEFIKIIKTVEEKVVSVLSNVKALLRMHLCL